MVCRWEVEVGVLGRSWKVAGGETSERFYMGGHTKPRSSFPVKANPKAAQSSSRASKLTKVRSVTTVAGQYVQLYCTARGIAIPSHKGCPIINQRYEDLWNATL